MNWRNDCTVYQFRRQARRDNRTKRTYNRAFFESLDAQHFCIGSTYYIHDKTCTKYMYKITSVYQKELDIHTWLPSAKANLDGHSVVTFEHKL